MRRFCAAILLLCLLLSCKRSKVDDELPVSVLPPAALTIAPSMILQAGEFPLWFQFTANGSVLIEAIEDACFSEALVPWPLAPHVRFILARGDDLIIAANRDGFISLSPQAGGRLGLYHFSGGDFWRQYTVGAFIMFDEQPAALLYRDDRFLDSDAPLPWPRVWTFNRQAAKPQPFALPAIDVFAPQDGWDIDALRRGGDGLWYFRAINKTGAKPEIKMLRSDLAQEGEPISLGAFQSAALPEPLSAAPGPLREMLAAVLDASGSGLAAVVSPDFPSTRFFATDRDKPALSCFYSAVRPDNAFLLTATPQGNALYAQAGAVRHFSLPPLPEGFCYTAIGLCADTIVASWEEQDEYSIGAAGFMVIRLR